MFRDSLARNRGVCDALINRSSFEAGSKWFGQFYDFVYVALLHTRYDHFSRRLGFIHIHLVRWNDGIQAQSYRAAKVVLYCRFTVGDYDGLETLLKH